MKKSDHKFVQGLRDKYKGERLFILCQNAAFDLLEQLAIPMYDRSPFSNTAVPKKSLGEVLGQNVAV